MNSTAVFFLIAFVMYFTPWITALSRHHPNRYAILVLNTFLGWTGICWVFALCWALTNFDITRERYVAR